jgi:SAM-dependent methyltransferase
MPSQPKNAELWWSLSDNPCLGKLARWARRKYYLPSAESLLLSIDAKKLNAVRQIHAAGISDQDLRATKTQLKYLDPLRQLRRNLRRAYELNLHGRPALNILDLGCGSGYFLKVCEALGHAVTGFDLDESDIYRDLIAVLGIRRITGRILAYEPTPGIEERYDLVTAFAICFNNHNEPEPWGCGEWEYFLRDTTSRFLKPEGKLILKLNPRDGMEGEAAFYSPELKAFFQRLGADIQGPLVTFRRKPVISKIGCAL